MNRLYKKLGAILLLAVLLVSMLPATAVRASSDRVLPGGPAGNNGVIRLTNMERAANGAPQVTAHPVLMALAQQRANEIAQHYRRDRGVVINHLRADGSPVWPWIVDQASAGGLDLPGGAAEILVRGREEIFHVSHALPAHAAVEEWMNSPGHRQLLLNPSYNVIGVAHAYRDGNNYWVQFLGYSPAIAAAPPAAGTAAPTAPVPAVTRPAATGETLSQADAAEMARQAVSAAAAGATPTVRLTNPGSVPLASMRAVTAAAPERTMRINADTLVPGGTAVDVRITVNPALATRDVNLSASTTSPTARSTANIFSGRVNGPMTVISTQQPGDFGMQVRFAARIDPGLDATALFFYRYNREANTFRHIEPTNISVDSNGFLIFTTGFAGDIIITNTRLHR